MYSYKILLEISKPSSPYLELLFSTTFSVLRDFHPQYLFLSKCHITCTQFKRQKIIKRFIINTSPLPHYPFLFSISLRDGFLAFYQLISSVIFYPVSKLHAILGFSSFGKWLPSHHKDKNLSLYSLQCSVPAHFPIHRRLKTDLIPLLPN